MIGQKKEPASEASFHDLVEALHRIRWARNRSPLVDKHSKSILDLLRTTRNYSAHPDRDTKDLEQDWRHLASVMARRANALWQIVKKKRARLVDKVIVKDW